MLSCIENLRLLELFAKNIQISMKHCLQTSFYEMITTPKNIASELHQTQYNNGT